MTFEEFLDVTREVSRKVVDTETISDAEALAAIKAVAEMDVPEDWKADAVASLQVSMRVRLPGTEEEDVEDEDE